MTIAVLAKEMCYAARRSSEVPTGPCPELDESNPQAVPLTLPK
jgi:hypothetical protein